MDARICLGRGALEYLAVPEGGKTHEAVLAVDADPRFVNAALMLAGFQPGDRLRIRARWTRDGVPHEADPAAWVAGVAGPLTWTYSGSRVQDVYRGRKVFAATYSGVLVTLQRDPDAVVCLPPVTGDREPPCTVAEQAVPPVGTKVELILERTGKGDR